jgi:hypothetical protein
MAHLGHELVHASGAAVPIQLSPIEEERAALAHEYNLQHDLAAVPTTRAQPTTTILPSAGPVGAIRTAQEDRPGAGPVDALRMAREDRPMGLVRTAREDRPTSKNHSELPAISERQLNMLKEHMYRDLMQRLRTEFERGS